MSTPTISTPPVISAPQSTVTTDVKQSTQPITAKEEKHKVKVNGKEVEVTIDELKRAYGLDKASRQRFDEASKKIKEAENLKSIFTNKEIDSLQKAGWTDDEIEQKAANFLVQRAKQKSMTPEQRAQAEREAEYERLKKEKFDREEAEKTRIKQDLEQREAKLYQTAFFNDVAKANKSTWLDLNDPVILSHVINDISLSLKNHDYDMPVTEAVKRLEEKMENMNVPKKEFLKKLLKSSKIDIDDNDLDAFLEKGSKGIRENSVAAIKRAEAPFAKTQQQTQAKAKTESLIPPVKHDANYYRDEAKRYRDLRYNRIKTK